MKVVPKLVAAVADKVVHAVDTLSKVPDFAGQGVKVKAKHLHDIVYM